MQAKKSQKIAAAFLAATSVVAIGAAGIGFLSAPPSEPTAGFESLSPARVSVNAPITAEAFRQQIGSYSKDTMTVVMLQKTPCAICPEVAASFEEIRAKTNFPFTVYRIDAAQNPEVAALLQQRNPEAPVRLHLFYNGVKIHESQGISTVPAHLQDYLYMAQEMAEGRVSSLDPYRPPSP